jgi:hypothetical protein
VVDGFRQLSTYFLSLAFVGSDYVWGFSVPLPEEDQMWLVKEPAVLLSDLCPGQWRNIKDTYCWLLI